MTPKSISVSSSGVSIMSASSDPAHAHVLPARHAGTLPHISWYAFISRGTRTHSALGFFFNCMSYMVLHMKGRDFFALQVWISSSGFRVVSLNKNKMLESNLSN